MSTIPASAIVQVTPSVLSAGGRALDIIGLILTLSAKVPIGTVAAFANSTDVGNYFGSSSNEQALAAIYFAGFDNSNVKPGRVLFAQYPAVDVAAFSRSGPVSGYTLAQLQAIATGSLTLPINGANITAPSVNLSTATSFSNAASIIKAAFTATQATSSGNTISGTTLTLGGTITGTWAPGQTVVGVGVTAGSYIRALLSGTPNTSGATYQLSASSTVGSPVAMTGAVIPNVTYDSVLGEFVFTTVLTGVAQSIGVAPVSVFATAIKMTTAKGAVASPGANATTPAAFMGSVVQVTQNWATFMTSFDPDAGASNDLKLAFAEWNATKNNRYEYVCWDPDTSAAESDPAPASLGALIKAAQISGTLVIGGDGTNAVTAAYAAFACGFGASLNFDQANGRTTLAFRKQSGLVATCSNESKADNLMANGYNFYGAYATANDENIFFYPGSVSGDFLWADSYVDQIWLNNQFQLALMVLLMNTRSIPYNQAGYSLIRAACMDTINQGLNFGVLRAGVTLSQAQAAEVNSDAGLIISNTLNERGWYLQILDATPQTRAARGSPPCTFWYMDGQSVQHINLASIELV